MVPVLAAVTVMLSGAAGADSAADGAELLLPFKQALKRALMQGLEEGPEQAIDVCRLEAPGIARRLSVDGVSVGRSSHRLRNPDNRGPDWVAPILARFVDDPAAIAPVTVRLDNDRLGYVEPIVTQPLCLACHGEKIEPQLAARIAGAYPEDKATGFRPGDLRGVFWAEYPATEDHAR